MVNCLSLSKQRHRDLKCVAPRGCIINFTGETKIDAQKTLKRQHYNPKDAFGPACYSCGDAWGDINYEIFLKGSTMVWVDMTDKEILEM